jgi:hypothetical protein
MFGTISTMDVTWHAIWRPADESAGELIYYFEFLSFGNRPMRVRESYCVILDF